ncbi:hypothetical protein KCV07_g10112, partial [Aureobasidium melanogenum]
MDQDHNPPVAGKVTQYPIIIGADLAGTIVSVGQDVTTRKVGKRVIANAPGVDIGNSSRTTIAFESVVVLPLACYTAMAGLFVPDQLGLSPAGLRDLCAVHPPKNSVLLVRGDSSSVGCCAVQMARADGYEVCTVASERNRALYLSIGAAKVFDRDDHNLEQLIVESLTNKTVVGALDCIVVEESTVNACARILAQAHGGKKVMMVLNSAADGASRGSRSTKSEHSCAPRDQDAWVAPHMDGEGSRR